MKGAITTEELRALINERCDAWGAATTLAHTAGVSGGTITQARYGGNIPPKVAKAMGYERVEMIEGRGQFAVRGGI